MMPTFVEAPGMSISGMQELVALLVLIVPQVCVPGTLS
jgi:hypothetical protein